MASEGRYDYKLYIEGIEVPFTSASITASVNSVGQCTINMPPATSLRLIRPRSLVHIFWLDDYQGPLPGGEFQERSVWRLLWEGEAIGYSYSKSAASRSMTLTCQDMTNYWQTTLNYQLSADQAGYQKTKKNLAIGAKKADVVAFQPITQFYNKFFEGRNFVDALLEMLKSFTDDLVHYSAINDRVKLNQKIDVVEDLESRGLLSSRVGAEWIRGIFGNQGGKISLLQFVNTLKQLIFYVHTPVVAPPFRKDGSFTSTILLPQIHMTLPPRCNCFFPDMITSLNFGRNFLAEPTRMLLSTKNVWAQNELFNSLYVAPAVLGEATDSVVIANNQGGAKLTPEQAVKFKGAQAIPALTEEEVEKGIIGTEVGLPFPKFAAMTGRGDVNETAKKVAEFQFQLARITNRSATMVMQFNPWPVVGFPCAMFDAVQSYFGSVVNITHNISTSEGSMTHIDTNMVREMIPSDGTNYVYMPDWINKKYHPDKVVGPNGTYSTLLGCDGMVPLGIDDARAALAPATVGPQRPSTSPLSGSVIGSVFGNFIQEEQSLLNALGFASSGQWDLTAIADQIFELERPSLITGETRAPSGEYDKRVIKGDSWQYCQAFIRRSCATFKEVWSGLYGMFVEDDADFNPPISVPSDLSFDAEIFRGNNGQLEFVGDSRLLGTPFDYSPNPDDIPPDRIVRPQSRNGQNVDVTTAGHKRFPIWLYRQETVDERAIDGR